MKDVADDLALIVRNAIAYIKELERQVNGLKREAEPVAWSHNLIDNIITHRPADIDRHPDRWTPLYTSPPQRKPLSKEEIDSIWDSEKAFADIYAIVRAIERAHGIGGAA